MLMVMECEELEATQHQELISKVSKCAAFKMVILGFMAIITKAANHVYCSCKVSAGYS